MRPYLSLSRPSSFRLHPFFLRVGVTGSTSDFESEDEGSTPSPASTTTENVSLLRSERQKFCAGGYKHSAPTERKAKVLGSGL